MQEIRYPIYKNQHIICETVIEDWFEYNHFLFIYSPKPIQEVFI